MGVNCLSETFVGFGESSGAGERPCIVVVDFIVGFTDPETQLGADFTAEVEATRALLDIARAKGVPIVFTTVAYEPHFRDGGHFIVKVPALKLLVQGSMWVGVDERLARLPSEPLVEKKYASSFFGTPLASMLTSFAVDTVIVTGCTTSGCVRATALDALQHGYRVVVPRECVGDRSQSAHEANLYDIQTKYGDVVSFPDVRDYLSKLK